MLFGDVPFESTAAHTDKVLGTVLDLVKVGFGALFGAKFTEWQKRRQKRLSQEGKLSSLTLRIMTNPLVNNFPSELIKMRNFFLDECPELLRSERNRDFFKKWLNDVSVLTSFGVWTKDKLEELHRDLQHLQPPT